MDFTLLLSSETQEKAKQYFKKISQGEKPGTLFSEALNKYPLDFKDNSNHYLEILFNTKPPQIFAESEVAGDGSDWNLEELGILGDISVALDVSIYDNGNHNTPVIHQPALPGHLVYTPGALLRNDFGLQAVDFDEVTSEQKIDAKKYNKLYARRLAPVLKYINEQAKNRNEKAMVTIPGLGCGQFAGKFRGQLAPYLRDALKELLSTIDQPLTSIGAVYFDPYSACGNERVTINGVEFLVRPLLKGNNHKSQLNAPETLADTEGEFKHYTLYSIVAWDHVSWPGNDYWEGSRATDDGVKAAATDTMYKMTGIQGTYNEELNKYLPPESYSNWADVKYKHDLEMKIIDRIRIY